jgi:hypothetical protein
VRIAHTAVNGSSHPGASVPVFQDHLLLSRLSLFLSVIHSLHPPTPPRPAHPSLRIGTTSSLPPHLFLAHPLPLLPLGFPWAFSCASPSSLAPCAPPTPSYLQDYCLNLITMLQSNDVTVIMVFDGGPLPVKGGTEVGRKASREKHKALGLACLAKNDRSGAHDHFTKGRVTKFIPPPHPQSRAPTRMSCAGVGSTMFDVSPSTLDVLSAMRRRVPCAIPKPYTVFVGRHPTRFVRHACSNTHTHTHTLYPCPIQPST